MTRFTRSAFVLAFLLAAPLAGCGHSADAPSLVGKEALDKLPEAENHQASSTSRRKFKLKPNAVPSASGAGIQQ